MMNNTFAARKRLTFVWQRSVGRASPDASQRFHVKRFMCYGWRLVFITNQNWQTASLGLGPSRPGPGTPNGILARVSRRLPM